MWMRLLPPVFVIASTITGYGDEKGVAAIGEGISSYRLSAQFCHWPIPSNIEAVLNSDEAHFKMKNSKAFASGERSGVERFHLLSTSLPNYCDEIKESRDSMTQDLASRAK